MAKEQYTPIVEKILRERELHKFKIAPFESFSQPNPSSVRVLLAERGWQRKWIFWFSIGWATTSLLFFITLVAIQTYARLYVAESFSLFDGAELQLIVVSVFGQILGIIYLIASKVWDNKDYLHLYK